MAQFRYDGYEYNLTSFYEFLNEFNIKNDEIANATNLNKAVNQLKRELNQVIGQIKILTSEESVLWNSMVSYEPGEIVSYFSDSKPTHTKAEIQASYYMALPSETENIAIRPPENADMWLNIKLEDLYPSLYLDNYAMKNQEQTDWDANQDYALVNIKKLTDKISKFKTEFLAELDERFLSFSNTKQFNTINRYNVASKKYVDAECEKLSNSVLNLDDKMKDYVKTDSTNKMVVSARPNDALYTPNAGILPGAANVSNLGSSLKKFANMYATNFVGTATQAKYADLAEVFESKETFDPGTIVALDPKTKDFIPWNPGYEIFGVVSDKPGLILNADAQGILIAHKGKTPIRVENKAKVGQIVIAYSDGEGIAIDKLNDENRNLKIGIICEIKKGIPYVKI